VATTIELRPLRATDDRSGFCCGEPALDRFIQHYAGQNQFKLRLAVTYVAVLGERILGFATCAAGSLEKQELPDEQQRRRLPTYPLPILRLARLGVDQVAQSRGIGRLLLKHVLNLALQQRDTVGCVGVVTDAKPGAISFYQGLGFIPLVGAREGALHGGATPMFLDIHTIAASARP
jgi:GNAT superfamily N-acetyltransferase